MRGYFAIARASFMVGMVYRFGFIFSIIGNIIYLSVAYFLWKSIYGTAETLRGLTFNETFLYVGLGSSVFILLKTYTDWFLHDDIREGAISMYLIKPVDVGLYTLFISIGALLLNIAIITLPTFLMLAFVFKVKFVVGAGLYLFPVSLFLAFLISFYIDYFIGLMGFYSESVWGLSTTKEILVTVLSGALIPLQFFPETIRNILYWLPFQGIYHTPLMLMTRPGQNMNDMLMALAVQSAWVLILFLATRIFYNQAIKVLRIGGG